jgi:fermentation-respiration switch protein FrsA (DUF1100 family)
MKWLFLFLVILLILFLALTVYAANFFLKVALERHNQWYATKGHQLMNPDNFNKELDQYGQTEAEQLALGAQFWEQPFAEDHWLQVADARLYGRLFLAHPESTKWVICVHGYRANGKRDMAYIASRFAEAGFNVLVPDLRAHGQSSGETIGMGWLDRFDIISWISYLIGQNEEAEIILMGGSMGAATVMMTSGESLPENVKGLIADCGYTSVYDEFKAMLQTALKLPAFPILSFANLLSSKKAGFRLSTASSVRQLEKNKRPILFIHGTGDKFVPYEMLQQNVAATQGVKAILTIEKAPHFSSCIYEPERYFATIFEFIQKNCQLNKSV